MSGICGLFHLNGKPIERGALEGMVASMARRGPDAAGTWKNGPVGFGHAALWATPEAAFEPMPILCSMRGLTVTADVRIDNRAELLRAVGTHGRSLGDVGDGQLILEAYEKWGESCPEKLLGDFAFSIWDRRKRTVFCARDHLGVKPFHYHLSDRIFAFSSEVQALLRLHSVPRRISHGRIADYLLGYLEGIDKTCTFYEDVLRLPPAHAMTIGTRGMTMRRYWSLDATCKIRCKTDPEYAEAFREVFTASVSCRLRNASGVGSMLSGGLDSSSVVGVAHQLMSTWAVPLRTFSGVSGSPHDCPETRSIQLVSRCCETDAHRVRIEQVDSMQEDLRHVLTQTTDPFDLSMPLVQTMYIAANRCDINVVLDGAASDVVTSVGDGYLTYLLQTGMWKTAVSEAFASSRYWRNIDSPWALLYRSGRAAFIPDWMRRVRQGLRRPQRLKHVLGNTVIDADFADRIGLLDRVRTLRAQSGVSPPADLREAHARAITHPFLTVACERYDRVAAAYSVERRDPFCDKRLVEFCVGLPWHQKVKNGWPKVLLRRATAGILPDEIRWRRGKEHLGWGFTRAWMTSEAALLRDTILGDLEHASEFIDINAVREAYQRYSAGRPREDDVSPQDSWTVM